MSVTDTTEDWWAFRANTSYAHIYVHAEGVDCGHFHRTESVDLTEIDCKACQQIIEKNEDLKLSLAKKNTKRQARRRKRENRKNRDYIAWKQTLSAKNGSCPLCHEPLIERENRKTCNHFLGCLSFPQCRYTRDMSS